MNNYHPILLDRNIYDEKSKFFLSYPLNHSVNE